MLQSLSVGIQQGVLNFSSVQQHRQNDMIKIKTSNVVEWKDHHVLIGWLEFIDHRVMGVLIVMCFVFKHLGACIAWHKMEILFI